jgi:hypothetical protein
MNDTTSGAFPCHLKLSLMTRTVRSLLCAGLTVTILLNTICILEKMFCYCPTDERGKDCKVQWAIGVPTLVGFGPVKAVNFCLGTFKVIQTVFGRFSYTLWLLAIGPLILLVCVKISAE